jgi:hypothetical protein
MEADWLWVPCSELPMELISFHYVSKCKNDKIKKTVFHFVNVWQYIYFFLMDILNISSLLLLKIMSV